MENALQINPNNYIAHQNLGRYFAKLGQIELARRHHDKVRELDPALANAFPQNEAPVPESKASRERNFD